MFSFQENLDKSLEKDNQWLLNVMRKNLSEVKYSKHFIKRKQERSISEDEFHELCDLGKITRVKPALFCQDDYLPITFELRLQKRAYDLVAIVATNGKEFKLVTVYRTNETYN